MYCRSDVDSCCYCEPDVPRSEELAQTLLPPHTHRRACKDDACVHGSRPTVSRPTLRRRKCGPGTSHCAGTPWSSTPAPVHVAVMLCAAHQPRRWSLGSVAPSVLCVVARLERALLTLVIDGVICDPDDAVHYWNATAHCTASTRSAHQHDGRCCPADSAQQPLYQSAHRRPQSRPGASLYADRVLA